ncbi:MAG: SGNH hydrolase domain-containing protein [Geminicoccaceae bacterium]
MPGLCHALRRRPAVCDFAPDSVLDAHRRAIEQLRALDDEYEVVWLDAAICAGGTCRSSMGDVFVFGKGSHLSHEGAALLGRRMGFFRAITGADAPVAQPVVDGATKP